MDAIVALCISVSSGCVSKYEDRQMPDGFEQPSLEVLRTIDLAESEYDLEIFEIEGVVSLTSQGGWPCCDDDYEIHNFALAAWSHTRDTGLESDLLVLRRVPQGADYFSDFPAGRVMRMKVLLAKSKKRAILVEVTDSQIENSELVDFAESKKPPEFLQTTDFGRLNFDPQRNTYFGKFNLGGALIEIFFDASENLNQQVDAASSILVSRGAYGDEVKRYVCDSLLESANEWNDESVSETIFLRKVDLNAISFNSDGSFYFWLSDGGLFGGHMIEVRGSAVEGLTFCAIAG